MVKIVIGWTRREWENYLVFDANSREEPVICIRESPYNYLEKGKKYKIIDYDPYKPYLYLTVMSVDDYSQGFDVSKVRRYNATYFLPYKEYIRQKEMSPPKCLICSRDVDLNNTVHTSSTAHDGYYDENGYIGTIKQICFECIQVHNVKKCGYCGGWFMNTFYNEHLGTNICPLCSKKLLLIECKNCGKKRVTYIDNTAGIFGKKNKRLCNRCRQVAFRRLLNMFNFREVKAKGIKHKERVEKNLNAYINHFTPKSRTFGLEFEVEVKGSSIEALTKIYRELNRIVLVKNGDKKTKNNNQTLVLGDLLIAKYDGSLGAGGIEFNTVILHGKEAMKHLKTIISVISKYCYVDDKCGLHLHVGAEDYNKTDLVKLYYFYSRFQKLFKFYVNNKRLKNRYCMALPRKRKNELLLNEDIHVRDRYRAVNFKAYEEYETIELRILEGTLDYDKIVSWINLHIKILDSIKKDNSLLVKDWRLLSKTRHIIGNKLYLDLKQRMKDFEDRQKPKEEKIAQAICFMYREVDEHVSNTNS